MQGVDEDSARRWLQDQGVTSARWLTEILDGFDFSQPAYLQPLFEGDVIYQYVRRPEHQLLAPNRGNWFCLIGASPAYLAIFGGLAGRELRRFQVESQLIALEGTSARKDIEWSWAGGGPGGATQLFVPPYQIARLGASAPHDGW